MRTALTLLAPVLALALVGCGSRDEGTASGDALPPPDQPMPEARVGTDVVAARGAAVTVRVDARADIFSAGRSMPHPERAGVLPSRVTLPEGTGRTITVTRAGGLVGCGAGEEPAGPAGGTCAGGATDIESADGISGIVHASRTQFLVGVFLTGVLPAEAPARLDVTPGRPGHEASRRPALAQTFYAGAGATVAIPDGATALYLGVADAWSFQGPPGYYGDNTGGFRVDVTVR